MFLKENLFFFKGSFLSYTSQKLLLLPRRLALTGVAARLSLKPLLLLLNGLLLKELHNLHKLKRKLSLSRHGSPTPRMRKNVLRTTCKPHSCLSPSPPCRRLGWQSSEGKHLFLISALSVTCLRAKVCLAQGPAEALTLSMNKSFEMHS